MNPGLFWLHIKKSAGVTTRRLLQPHYVEVDRNKKPKCFAQAHLSEYNDILNNYRVVLGDYQFKRCQFARKFLYQHQWSGMVSFAFAREPVDRCLSMFWYLSRCDKQFQDCMRKASRGSMGASGQPLDVASAFDIFLDQVQQARCSDSIYHPVGLHFTTHTAPMWDDIVDEKGRLLLTEVFRVESLAMGINRVFERCGLAKRLSDSELRLNQNAFRNEYWPSAEQRRKIEHIYRRDFDVYESASHG